MFKQQIPALLLLATCVFISGCGGGGGGSSSNSSFMTEQPSTSFAGLWFGTLSNDNSSPDEELVAISVEGGRIEFLLVDSGIQFSGVAVASGNDIGGSGSAYAPTGGFLPDNTSKVSPFSFTATLEAGVSLSGDWQIDAGNFTGSFTLEYDPEHTKDAALSLVSGIWTSVTPAISFDIDANGNIFGQSAVCTSAGEVTVADPEFNTYQWRAVTSGATCPSNGEEFFALGALNATDDALFLIGSSNLHPLLLELEK